MINIIPQETVVDIVSGAYTFTSATLNCVLLNLSSATTSADLDTWSTLTSAITQYEVSGSGYTSGGKQIQNVGYSDYTSATVVVQGDDVTWTSTYITANAYLVYDTSNNKVIMIYKFDTEKSTTNGDFSVHFNVDSRLMRFQYIAE